jgi:hypothetical protein
MVVVPCRRLSRSPPIPTPVDRIGVLSVVDFLLRHLDRTLVVIAVDKS